MSWNVPVWQVLEVATDYQYRFRGGWSRGVHEPAHRAEPWSGGSKFAHVTGRVVGAWQRPAAALQLLQTSLH